VTEERLGTIIVWVAALFVGAVSEFFPVPGLLAAALVFPTGIHSGHGTAYLVLALILNFALFFGATFWAMRFFLRRRQAK
jgi:hypothetical protein